MIVKYEIELRLGNHFIKHGHWVKKVRIRSFSSPYFPAFGLNMKRYSVSLRIQSECGKIRTRKTPKYGLFSRSGRQKDISLFILPGINESSFEFVKQ